MKGWSSERGKAEGKSDCRLHQSFYILRSPPLQTYSYIVKLETAAALNLLPHSQLETVIVQHYER